MYAGNSIRSRWIACCHARSPSCPCTNVSGKHIGTTTGANELLNVPPSEQFTYPTYGQKGPVYQIDPNFVTGRTPSSGPINTSICKLIDLPGCETVVDPQSGKPVAL
jgi:hypothetical protein